jgi:hypothetical protein
MFPFFPSGLCRFVCCKPMAVPHSSDLYAFFDYIDAFLADTAHVDRCSPEHPTYDPVILALHEQRLEAFVFNAAMWLEYDAALRRAPPLPTEHDPPTLTPQLRSELLRFVVDVAKLRPPGPPPTPANFISFHVYLVVKRGIRIVGRSFGVEPFEVPSFTNIAPGGEVGGVDF